MSEVGLFAHLPQEIFDVILSDTSLDHIDVCRFGGVCRICHESSLSPATWKAKFKQRWPRLFCSFPTGGDPPEWREEYKQRHMFCSLISHLLSQLSAKFYSKQDVGEEGILPFLAEAEKSLNGFLYMKDELLAILNDQKSRGLLTKKFYARKVLGNIIRSRLKRDWCEFFSLPPGEQLLEHGAAIISLWCQPMMDVNYQQISTNLDSIALRVIEALRRRNIKISLGQESCEASQSRTILETINTLQSFHLPPLYHCQVLEMKTGIPITLSIVYAGVARRLGVECEAINFPSHFLLRWREHPELSDGQEFTYIDAYNGGLFMSRPECSRLLPAAELPDSCFQVASTLQVLQRVVRNLVAVHREQGQLGHSVPLLEVLRNVVELQCILDPEYTEGCILLTRINLHLGINHAQSIDLLKRIPINPLPGLAESLLRHHKRALERLKEEEEEIAKELNTKSRSLYPAVCYSVGLVMVHRRYDYSCVIYGWDETCKASESWIIQMGVNNLPQKQFQPFYNVLVSDGSSRYAAQENLRLSLNPTEITNDEIGRYFQDFTGEYYVANDQLRGRYPEDAAGVAMTTSATDEEPSD
ncbi:hypothetical protein CAPTEDRAFT_213768 [Capitella teleta]|uniref:Hemimethylated DNA-binding domain-containing protein n=1 Tax=Capitella teleta TaxID=283909 RepID=R7U7U7_CAPTE|nr:hypothetical protein CAPTEDRAFT_213768 [Capitella teleta]|eukprot:ELU02231.1 hypothetical protein CAPTEDRAFT_213768 [Capitella teleta]